MSAAEDETLMRRALELARQGWGRTHPNPMVGALARRYNATESDVRTKVANRNYGMVLTEFDDPYFCDPELLKKNYDKVEQVDYFTYFGHSPVRVWRPKPKDPADISAP